MSQIYATHKRKILAGGALIGTYALLRYTDALPNPFSTPGVKNIEKRYSSGGGAKNHQPGTATKLGNHDHVEGNVETMKGVGTPHYQENVGGQKPDVSAFVFAMFVGVVDEGGFGDWDTFSRAVKNGQVLIRVELGNDSLTLFFLNLA
ncbi:hypothetical protein ACLMJK_005976 [Lecanora helva]